MRKKRSVGLMALALTMLVVAATSCAPAEDSRKASRMVRRTVRPEIAVRAGVTRIGRQGTIKSSRTGPSRCPTIATRMTAGRGAPWAACMPKHRTGSGSRCAASSRYPKAPSRGPRTGRPTWSGTRPGNTDGLSATCNPNNPRGWERRFEHSIIVLDGDGNLIDEWPHLDELFSQLPCGRGAHQIKQSARTIRRSTSGSSTTSST